MAKGEVMAILDRIRRVARANITQLLNRVETPESEITEKIRELEDASREAKDALAGFAVTYKRLEKNIADLQNTRAEWQARAEEALKGDDETTARRALGERVKVEERLKALEPVLQSRRETYDELREDLLRIHDQLNHARARVMDLRARKRAAEAEKAMGRQVSALEGGVETEGFERMEDEVMAAEAQVEIDRELRGALTPLSESMERDAQNRKIDNELDALKRKLSGGDPT